LAEAYVETGRLDDGFSALAEAQAVADKNEEREHEAEIHRLKGELLLRRDESDAAEAQVCFQRAIEVARKQSAKSLELRATTSLARLLRDTGRPDEARATLSDIAGSPRASTPHTSKTPKPSSTNSASRSHVERADLPVGSRRAR
jgi:predicted negative regulator of RcsB-dependent stress response